MSKTGDSERMVLAHDGQREWCPMSADIPTNRWGVQVLQVAGLVHCTVGIAMMLFPTATLGWLGHSAGGLEIPLWQCIGCFVSLTGGGYLRAAKVISRHLLFLTLALIGQSLIVLGAGLQVAMKSLPINFFWMSMFVSGIWVIPLGIILWKAILRTHFLQSAHSEPEADEPLLELRTNTQKLLDEIADEQPQMVVFLRHAGCTFCRQALADIQSVRKEIEEIGCGIVLVHLGREEDPDAVSVFKKYGVDDLPRISDPSSRLYRQFGLDLGGFRELFGIRVWLRGFFFGVINGHGIGSVRGNSFQMPGVYLYHRGLILGGFRHESASDRPDYLELARQVAQDRFPILETASTI